ncbi:MAG TPA: C25 family cysteine peptidase, partial [Xanthomonadales bacterium]|nr:C25 family cysteine peptidase [Xanthomonadales bacterium]
EIPASALRATRTTDAWSWATTEHAPQQRYNYASPLADPWQAEQLFAPNGSPTGVDVALPTSARADVPGVAAHVVAQLVGLTDWASLLPDHHASLAFNGTHVAAVTGDGVVTLELAGDLPVAALGDANVARVALPADTGFAFDMADLERVTLDYPRLPVAESGRWSAVAVAFGAQNGPASQPLPATAGDALFGASFEESEAAAHTVLLTGLATSDVVAYGREPGGSWQRLADTRVASFAGGHAAWLPGRSDGAVEYLVSEAAAAFAPAVEPRRAPIDITSGQAEYLVVTHPAFTAGLSQLLALKRAQGLSTAFVETTQIYRQYGDGVPGAAPIARYIADAIARRGTRYVLLVGGDSYDYKDYHGGAAFSFVPTMYGQVEELIRYAPSDTRYADVDGDQQPDVAIGRLPVRSRAELDAVVAKIAAYSAADAQQPSRMVLASGAAEEQQSFRALDEQFASLGANGRDVVRAHVDDLGAAGARTALLAALDTGPAIVSFAGHSAPGQWTFDPLATTSDVAALGNAGRPGVYLQWGCWTSYFVLPTSVTMSQALLVAPDRGAAATIGATALSDFAAHRELSRRLATHMVPGTRIGDALLAAKRELGAGTQMQPDAIYGIELLGDPAMPLR